MSDIGRDQEVIASLQNELDRTIGFVSNCDSKTSIMLGFNSIVITVLFSCTGINDIVDFFKKTYGTCPFFGIIMGILAVMYLFGTYKYIVSLRAALNIDKLMDCEQDSKIFFGHIAKNCKYPQFKKKYMDQKSEDRIDDYLSQIFINSKICNKKFKNYNTGLVLSCSSLFGILLLIGIFFYFIEI